MLCKWCFGDERKANTTAPSLVEAMNIEHSHIGKAISVWDKETLAKRLQNDQTIINEIVKMFGKHSAEKMTAIEQAVSAHDTKLIKELSHALKGMSSNIGAMEVHSIAAEIEEHAVDISASELKAKFLQLTIATERLQQELDKHLSTVQVKVVQKQPVDKEFVHTWLSELKISLSQGEFLTLEVFSSIEIFDFELEIEQLVEALKEQVSIFDTNNAIITVEKIQKQL